MPRPKDLFKGLLMVLTFGIGTLAVGGTEPRTLLRALLVLAAVELLIYPARYQWNDVRGFAADQRHPAKAGRGRLPGPVENARRHVLASSAVAVARLLACALVAVLFPALHLGGILTAVTLGVFGVAIAYEVLRTAGTGRSGRVPTPLHPTLVLVWIVVGAGYAVRGMTGLWLAVDLGQRPALAAAATVTLWAFGTAFVTSRWALEATAFARIESRRIRWDAHADHAREHLLALVRWLPGTIDDGPVGDPRSPATWAALRGRTSPWAPWNVAMLIAASGAALTGRLLAGPTSAPAAALAASAGAVIAIASLAATRWRAAVVVGGAAALTAVLAVGGTPRPLIAVLPWLAVMTAHAHFSRQCLSGLGGTGARVRALLGPVAARLGRLVVGRATWQMAWAAPERTARRSGR